MKRLLKSWVFWAFVAVPPIAALIAFSSERYEQSHCRICWAQKSVTQWRFRPMGEDLFPLFPAREVVYTRPRPSPPHDHRWTLEWKDVPPPEGRR